MSAESLRFWPSDLAEAEVTESPANILKAAADELEEATAREVSALLKDETQHDGNVCFAFFLRSRRDTYRYLLFRALFEGSGFPVQIFDRPGDDVEKGEPPFTSTESRRSSCATSAELEAELKRLFGLDATKRIVAQIASLSRAAS